MRSARVTIAAVAVCLVLLPFALLLCAWSYERVLVLADERELTALLTRATSMPAEQWPALAAREKVWLRQYDAQGQLTFDSGTADSAVTEFVLSALLERALSVFSAATPHESLSTLSLLAPTPPRLVALARHGNVMTDTEASASGQTVLINAALGLPHGEVLLAQRGNHRGVRQLLLARRQLAKLVLYQLLFTALAVWLLSRWLVKPLEQLSARALAYQGGGLHAEGLLQRRDEVGQLARAFEQLTASLELKRAEAVRLAADIAHELKNPLATISAASELIAMTADASVEKRAQAHRTVSAAVERLSQTVEALHDVAKLERQLPSSPRHQLDYGPWLDALLSTYRSDPRYEAWHFELQTELGVRACVSAEAWASLLRNLVDNALVQPSTQRRVRVRAFIRERRLVTQVTDFGPGVSSGNRARVFERFFTARPEGAPRGTGLGLTIVKTVAEAHGGNVELLPSVEGEGATFEVSVPTATR